MAPAFILAANNTSLRALEEVTRTVPIVFAQVADPVGSGHLKFPIGFSLRGDVPKLRLEAPTPDVLRLPRRERAKKPRGS